MTESPDFRIVCRSPLGAGLDENQCKVLANLMGVRRLTNDEVLVNQGDTNTTLHLLAAGKLIVESTWEGEPVTLYTLREGEFAGTRSFVDRSERQATLRAVGDTTVYTLDPAAFEALLSTHPHIVYEVMRAIFRMTHTNLMRMDMESQQLKNYFLKQRGRY